MLIRINDIADIKGLASVVGKEVNAEEQKLDDYTGYMVSSEELMRVGKPFRVKHVVEGREYIMFDSTQVTVIPSAVETMIAEDYGPMEAYLAEEAEGTLEPAVVPYAYRRQKKYNEANTVMKAIRLNKNTDADILAFLEVQHFQTITKQALRMLMATMSKEEVNG